MRRKRGHHSARASGRSISGAKYFSPMSRNARAGLSGSAVAEGLGEFAQRIVDGGAAVGGRQRHVDGVERHQPQDMPGIDRIGIAQPVLDRRHRQFQRAAGAWRLWRRLRDRLDLVGLVDRSAKRTYFSPACFAVFQRSLARDRLEPVQETRGDRRRAADFGGVAEDDVAGAEQLREIVRRQSDAPLRQIEAEFVPHRPAQPGIDPRRRRPDAFHQSAENDAVRLGQPRFQRAVDFQPRIGRLRPPHHAVAKGGLENLRIIAELDREPAWALAAEQIVERLRQRRPLRAFEGDRRAMPVARQLHQHVAMAPRQLGKIMGP